MKKEGGSIFQDVEKKYGLNKYKKTEYLKRMLKEFAKYDKKLVKIDKYEKMQKEGKVLNEEMLGLISKKPGFLSHIDSLKVALDIYNQSLTVEDEPLAPVSSTDIQKNIKTEVEVQMKEFTESAMKKLSYFFSIARVLAEKDRIDANPLAEVSVTKQKSISEMYKELTTLPRDEETSLAEESKKVAKIFDQILKADNSTAFIGEFMDNEVAEMKFTVKKLKENEYETTQAVSILKVELKDETPAPPPVQEQIPTTKEDPIIESAIPLKETQQPDVEPEPEVKPEDKPEPVAEKPQEIGQQSWYDKDSDEEEDQPQDQANEENKTNEDGDFVWQKKREEEEEFETFVSKTDARKKAKEGEGKTRGFRGVKRDGRFAEKRYRGGMRGEGYKRPEKKEENKKVEKEEVQKEGDIKKEEKRDEGYHEGGNYRGGYRGNYRGRRRGGYYRGGRRNDYSERGEYRGRRRYNEARGEYFY